MSQDQRNDKLEQADHAFETWWREKDYDGFGFATSKGVARSAWHRACEFRSAERQATNEGQTVTVQPASNAERTESNALPAVSNERRAWNCDMRCYSVADENRCVDCPARLPQAAQSSEPLGTGETPRTDAAWEEVRAHSAYPGDAEPLRQVAGDLERELAEAAGELRAVLLAPRRPLRSATLPSKEFAARVRPAVAAWVNKCDRSVLNPTFPKHYGPLLQSEADKAHALLEEIDAMIGEAPECSHYWIPNSGKGGEPEFRLSRQMGTEPVMHVMCSLCDTRTWFTEKQWQAIPATVEPRRLDSTTKEVK